MSEIKKLVGLLETLDELDREIRETITEQARLGERLSIATTKQAAADAELKVMLDGLDIVLPDDHEWSSQFAEFLTGIIKHMKAR